MLLKKVGIFLFILFSILPIRNSFAQTQNAGIIPANIWYSKDPFEEGDKIKIYTVVYNTDTRELSGTVIFFDKTTLLGTKTFVVNPKSIKDISIDWTVTSGDHTIFAKIENAKFLISKDKYEEVYVAENKTEESKRSVSKKINLKESADNLVNSVSNSNTISGIQKTISEKTPPFITKSLDSTIGFLENTREGVADFSDNKKIAVKKEINILDNKEVVNEKIIEENAVKKLTDETKIKDTKIIPEENKKAEASRLIKPFKYVELFLMSLISFIFNNKIVFYLLLLTITFFILRFIWRLIFN